MFSPKTCFFLLKNMFFTKKTKKKKFSPKTHNIIKIHVCTKIMFVCFSNQKPCFHTKIMFLQKPCFFFFFFFKSKKDIFYQKPCFHQKICFHQTPCFHKTTLFSPRNIFLSNLGRHWISWPMRIVAPITNKKN